MKYLYLLALLPPTLAIALGNRDEAKISLLTPRAIVYCGSRGMALCASGYTCIPDPTAGICSFQLDCPGYCVLLDGPQCAGIRGAKCPDAEQVCNFVPGGDCDPRVAGNSDCAGTCVYLDGRSGGMYG